MAKITFAEALELNLNPSELCISDGVAENRIPLNCIKVDTLDILSLDSLHSEIHARKPERIVGIGGFTAVNAAKVLSVKRLKKGGLKQAVFENPFPLIPVTLVPTARAFCTEVTPLTIFFDSSVPVYNVLFIDPETVKVPLNLYSRNPEQERGGYTPTSWGEGKLQDYISFCSRAYTRLLDLEFILSLSIAALTGGNLEVAYSCIRQLSEKPLDEIALQDTFSRIARQVERKVDHYVEHTWSFYRNFLVKWGVRNRAQLYKKYVSILSYE